MDALGDVTLEGVKSTILVLSGKGALCNLHYSIIIFINKVSGSNRRQRAFEFNYSLCFKIFKEGSRRTHHMICVRLYDAHIFSPLV